MFSTDSQSASRLDSQSTMCKFQMFILFSGRHISVAFWYWVLYISVKHFNDICSLGKHTSLKLREVSYLVIFYIWIASQFYLIVWLSQWKGSKLHVHVYVYTICSYLCLPHPKLLLLQHHQWLKNLLMKIPKDTSCYISYNIHVTDWSTNQSINRSIKQASNYYH